MASDQQTKDEPAVKAAETSTTGVEPAPGPPLDPAAETSGAETTAEPGVDNDEEETYDDEEEDDDTEEPRTMSFEEILDAIRGGAKLAEV